VDMLSTNTTDICTVAVSYERHGVYGFTIWAFRRPPFQFRGQEIYFVSSKKAKVNQNAAN